MPAFSTRLGAFFCLVIGDTGLPKEARKLTKRAVAICVQDFIVPAFVDVADVKKEEKKKVSPGVHYSRRSRSVFALGRRELSDVTVGTPTVKSVSFCYVCLFFPLSFFFF